MKKQIKYPKYVTIHIYSMEFSVIQFKICNFLISSIILVNGCKKTTSFGNGALVTLPDE